MLKIITWNIQWGLGIDGIVDLERLIDEARALADFDVLCLQEVSDNFSELKGNGGQNQFMEIGTLLPGYTAVEGVALDIPDGRGRRRFGNMILSRLPVAQVLRYTLPWEAAATRNMPRLLLEAVVEAPSGPLRIMTTHLEASADTLRRAQVEGIREAHRTACERTLTPREDGPGTYVFLPTSLSAVLTGDQYVAGRSGEAADLGAVRQRCACARRCMASRPWVTTPSALVLPLRAVERPSALLRFRVRDGGSRIQDQPDPLRSKNAGLRPPARSHRA